MSEIIILSSLYLGSIYMTATSLKELNKIAHPNVESFTLTWTIFITSSLYLLKVGNRMSDILVDNNKLFSGKSLWN